MRSWCPRMPSTAHCRRGMIAGGRCDQGAGFLRVASSALGRAGAARHHVRLYARWSRLVRARCSRAQDAQRDPECGGERPRARALKPTPWTVITSGRRQPSSAAYCTTRRGIEARYGVPGAQGHHGVPRAAAAHFHSRTSAETAGVLARLRPRSGESGEAHLPRLEGLVRGADVRRRFAALLRRGVLRRLPFALFDVPRAEAMVGCGTPAFNTNHTALPELVAGAGLLVESVDVVGAAVTHILTERSPAGDLRPAWPPPQSPILVGGDRAPDARHVLRSCGGFPLAAQHLHGGFGPALRGGARLGPRDEGSCCSVSSSSRRSIAAAMSSGRCGSTWSAAGLGRVGCPATSRPAIASSTGSPKPSPKNGRTIERRPVVEGNGSRRRHSR